MAQNFVELNGNRYDAETGALLNAAPQKLEATRLQVIKQSEILTHNPSNVRQPHHIAARQPKHSQTLRRDVVKHPNILRKAGIKIHAPAKIGQYQPDVLHVQPKLSSETVNLARANRAQAVAHSSKIERFRPVQPQRHYTPPISTVHTSIQSKPIHQQQETTRHQDIFEQAITRATSHEQVIQPIKSKHTRQLNRRFVQTASSLAILLLLGGFIFWQNRVSVEIELAAARSGVAATMPSYRPSGFALYELNYGAGSVTLGFRGSNNKAFSLVQQSSNWDSQTLLQNYVATSGQTYSTYLASGRTVYMYGDNATWVSGGIWYQINDDGSLSNGQIISLANSM